MSVPFAVGLHAGRLAEILRLCISLALLFQLPPDVEHTPRLCLSTVSLQARMLMTQLIFPLFPPLRVNSSREFPPPPGALTS